jgi:hypothetical protein
MNKYIKNLGIYMSYKELILKDFIESNKYLPKQGSKEWLDSRLETIGGSEISTIMGLNPYQNIKKLIMQKLGITNFVKSAPLWFGNILEYPLQKYTELIFNTTIYETGSIPFKKSKFIKYSPDGIAVIKKDKLQKIYKDFDIINNRSNFDNSLEELKDELLILFEFKNPYMRVIKQNEIPIYYKPQPQLGLEVIDICEASIFIESIFRFCSYNDIISANYKYNTRYHYDKVKYTNKPICYSAFSLYYEKNNKNMSLINILDKISEYMYNNDINDYDISNISDTKLLNLILENIVDYKDIKIIYHDIYLNNKHNYHDTDIYYYNKYNNINKFREEFNSKKKLIQNDESYVYLGCMCYKMFNINIQPVYKSDIINDNLLEKVKNVIESIKYCKQLDCVDLQKKYINTKF